MFRSLVLLFVTFVSSASGQTAPPANQGKIILVLLNQQRLIATNNGVTVYNFHCCTGRKGMETPTGQTTVQQKVRYNHALAEFGGGAIPYTLRVHMYDRRMKKRRRIDIHAYGSVPNQPASHGCIRLAKASAAKLFAWADTNMPVIVIDGPPAKKS